MSIHFPVVTTNRGIVNRASFGSAVVFLNWISWSFILVDVHCFILRGECTAFPVQQLPKDLLVDTTGAGDAFAGGFLSGLVLHKSIAECVEAGHWAAREIIRQHGATVPEGKTYCWCSWACQWLQLRIQSFHSNQLRSRWSLCSYGKSRPHFAII